MLNQIKTQGVYNGVETTYPGPAHLSLGQEATAVGQAYLLDRNDITFGSHRSHSEILAKSLSCIQKLSDQELLDVMENFLGGKTLRAVEKLGETQDVAETVERMTRICRHAADPEISPYVDFDKNPAYIENLMFSNETVPAFDPGRKPAALVPKEECGRWRQLQGKERVPVKDGKPVSKMKLFNLRDAVSEVILDKFYEDPTLVSYGEDVRDWGGAFAVYRGFADALPHSRLFNAPISESAIVGTAVGYGMCGGRCIVELMYADFIGCAGDEIFNQLSKWQAMSAGILKMPVVLRVSVGSKYGAQHSQDWTALCAHIPGLKVCFPATPWEAMENPRRIICPERGAGTAEHWTSKSMCGKEEFSTSNFGGISSLCVRWMRSSMAFRDVPFK